MDDWSLTLSPDTEAGVRLPDGSDDVIAADSDGAPQLTEQGMDAEAGPTVTGQSFCSDFTSAVCDWFTRCLGSQDCQHHPRVASIAKTCATSLAAVANGRLAFEPSHSSACVAAEMKRVCDSIPPGGYLENGTAPCDGISSDVVPMGGQCFADYIFQGDECADGYCRRTECPGTCFSFVPLGQPCDDDVARCDTFKAYCQQPAQQGATRNCVARGSQNAGCLNSSQCATTLTCSTNGDQGCAFRGSKKGRSA